MHVSISIYFNAQIRMEGVLLHRTSQAHHLFSSTRYGPQTRIQPCASYISRCSVRVRARTNPSIHHRLCTRRITHDTPISTHFLPPSKINQLLTFIIYIKNYAKFNSIYYFILMSCNLFLCTKIVVNSP